MNTKTHLALKWSLGFLAMVVVLLWPALINRSPLLFYDSIAYLEQGQEAFAVLFEAGAEKAAVAPATPRADRATPRSRGSFLRSFGYPPFVYLASLTPVRTFGPLLVQTAVVLAMIVLLFRSAAPRSIPLWVALAPAALFTSLPWFCSYLMPDVLAAVVIMFGMYLVAEAPRRGWLGPLFASASAAFACFAHYGHIPLQIAVSSAALVLLVLQRRLGVPQLTLAYMPAALAIAANLAVSSAAYHDASVAPKHLPILLARSIEDGPARWHLRDRCAQYRYAICELYPKMPDNVTALLWNHQTNIASLASPAQMDRIRREEPVILWRAFLSYPLEQTASLGRNAALQFVSVGYEDLRWARLSRDASGRPNHLSGGEPDRTGLDLFGALNAASAILGAVVIVIYACRDRLRAGRREREMLLLLVAGLVANAVIFGGLSAPVGRYQARIIWLAPLFATFCWANRRRNALQLADIGAANTPAASTRP